MGMTAGYQWIVNFWRLVLYAALLLPGFIQIIGCGMQRISHKNKAIDASYSASSSASCAGCAAECLGCIRQFLFIHSHVECRFYFLSPRVIRNIAYGRGVRAALALPATCMSQSLSPLLLCAAPSAA